MPTRKVVKKEHKQTNENITARGTSSTLKDIVVGEKSIHYSEPKPGLVHDVRLTTRYVRASRNGLQQVATDKTRTILTPESSKNQIAFFRGSAG